jgi:hypothetical protein
MTVRAHSGLANPAGAIILPALEAQLARVAPAIARWADRVPVPEGADAPQAIHDLIAAHPFLGPAFEFLPTRPDLVDQVHGLFAFNYSALLSLGLSASVLSGLRQALPKLASFIGHADHEFVGQWPLACDIAGQAA